MKRAALGVKPGNEAGKRAALGVEHRNDAGEMGSIGSGAWE